jgi:two-component system, sensor histidine kinase PdtaS
MRQNLKKLFLLPALLIIGSYTVFAQDSLNKKEQLLRYQLQNARTDTARDNFLLELGAFFKNRLPRKTANLDSALLYSDRSLKLSLQIKDFSKQGRSYNLLSQVFGLKGKYDKAKNYSKMAIEAYGKARDYDGQGDAYTQLAGYFNHNNNTVATQKINLLKEALRAYSESGNKIKMGQTFEKIGNMYCINSEQYLAIKNLKEGLNIFQSANYKNLQGIYHFLNESYDELGDYKQALIYGLQAMKVAATVGDSSIMLAAIYNHIGKTYRNLGQMEKAQYYERYALHYAMLNPRPDTTNNTLPDYTIIALNLSGIYVNENKENEALKILQTVKTTDPESKCTLYSLFLRVYTQLRQNDQAEVYFDKLKNALKQVDQFSYVNEAVNSSIVAYLFEKKQYDLARVSILNFEHTPHYEFTKAKLVSDQHWMFRIDSAQGNYLSAIRHSALERKMQDFLMTEEKNKNIMRLEVEYETEKKEKEIKLKNQNIQLLTKQSQLQQASLHTAALVRNFIITGTIMLALVLALGYNRYQIKQKHNKQLEIQQEVINNKNKSLERLIGDKDDLLKEKEWLLKEIHHRVKNNLQIVISLLNTQSVYLENSEALEAIRESQHRMHSISLIHQKLYQSDNIALIKMDEYISELMQYLWDSFNAAQNIEMALDIKPIRIDVVQAVPIGLILNEAVTNAIKYAFPPEAEGRITVSLIEYGKEKIALTISDNGCGLPPDFKIENCTSLGMCLIKGLSKQLQGEVKISSAGGLSIRVIMPLRSVLKAEKDYHQASDTG